MDVEHLVIQGVQTYLATKSSLTDAIVNAIPAVYEQGFHMILSGNSSQIITAILMLSGLTMGIVKGLWKMIASTFFHELVSFIVRGVASFIGLLFRRFST